MMRNRIKQQHRLQGIALIELSAAEYAILKNLDSKWKYIARDNVYNELHIYENKPTNYKSINIWASNGDFYELPYPHLFQFVKWKDGAVLICQLIEQYERDHMQGRIKMVKNRIKQQLKRQGIEYLKNIGKFIYDDQQKIDELIKEHERAEDLIFYGLQAVYESYDAGTEIELIQNDMKSLYGDEIIEDFIKEQNKRFKNQAEI